MTRSGSEAHVIHLRRPWDCATIDTALGTGAMLYTRSFGCPTNLAGGDQVDLVVSGVNGLTTVTLNGQEFATNLPRELRINVTTALKPRNKLQLALLTDNALNTLNTEPPWSEESVRLEIRSAI